MYALFDDAGKFHAGRLMSEADSSVQVELDSGKRVKVKAANVMLRFDKPAPAELMAQAQALAAQIDLDLAWEFAPDSDFSFAADGSDATVRALHAWMTHHLAEPKMPSRWWVVGEIPRTSRGKINREAVKAACAGKPALDLVRILSGAETP